VNPITPVVHALVKSGITDVVGIPDNTSGPLFDAVDAHRAIRLVTATREGEAIAVATGLWLGGASPLVVIQNTGLLESGDSLRGTAVRMAAPIPLLVTGRGYTKMVAAGIEPGPTPDFDTLTRLDIDSAAVLTEPTLEAWGVPYRRCEGDTDPHLAIEAWISEAHDAGRPTALILARPLV
jgi:sulfopyruvate decarboxylase subunit alpha